MGPLDGVRVVELAAIGPVPFAGMVLADLGADVVRVDRIGGTGPLGQRPEHDVVSRGRRSIAADLKSPEGLEVLLSLVDRADTLIEGFRPGVAERLGLGPEVCLARNPRLVYGRMTGWGQDGPLASSAGHDIDYIALAGALAPIGREGGPPSVPLNLVGDYGGGGMLLALGVVCALFEATRSGLGQVVDAAMVDGAALLTSLFHGLVAAGAWHIGRGTNVLDSGAPFYDVYETADGKFMAVGALEPKFYAELIERLGLADLDPASQLDASTWPETKKRLASVFRGKDRAHWVALFEGSDACVAPVLELDEAPRHQHNRARQTFVELGGVVQPAPAPRFARSVAGVRRAAPRIGEHTDEILAEIGLSESTAARLKAAGTVA